MELYHIHLMGNYDELYQKGSEFIVDKDKFNNRMYNRIYNMNPSVRTIDYPAVSIEMLVLQQMLEETNLGNIIDFLLHSMEDWDKIDWYNYSDAIKKVLEKSKKIILAEGINIREIALEEYRKNNCPLNPSRLHSLFACKEEGLDYWLSRINDNDTQIFKINVHGYQFVSNEQLLPDENISFGDKLKQAYKYYHPKKEDLNPKTDEYLVQGRVKILERIK